MSDSSVSLWSKPFTKWRICIDFGTATSKASAWRTHPSPHADYLRPLPLGAVAGGAKPYLLDSALLIDKGGVWFGPSALKRARDLGGRVDLLRSFKTFLAANDLNEALSLKLRRSADPTASYTHRDAILIYLAYLLNVVDRTARADPDLADEAGRSPLRFAHPMWRRGLASTAVVARLFDEAAVIAERLAIHFADPDSISHVLLHAALREAQSAPSFGRMQAAIFEAHAAAAAHFSFSQNNPHPILIFDMGAGTTDLTAFESGGVRSDASMREIDESRRTLSLACDEVDLILLNMVVDKAKFAKESATRRRLWYALAPAMRTAKEVLFKEKVCELQFEGHSVVLRFREVLASPRFRAFRSAIQASYSECLEFVSQRAVESGQDTIDVLLAGGGSALPFIQEMAAKTKPQTARLRRVRVAPIVPDWAYDPSFGDDFVRVFPQMAIAIGGSVAKVAVAQ